MHVYAEHIAQSVWIEALVHAGCWQACRVATGHPALNEWSTRDLIPTDANMESGRTDTCPNLQRPSGYAKHCRLVAEASGVCSGHIGHLLWAVSINFLLKELQDKLSILIESSKKILKAFWKAS